MGFSRQEYWSGVPLPSPIDDSSTSLLFSTSRFFAQSNSQTNRNVPLKGCYICVYSVAQLYLTLCDLMRCTCQAPQSMAFVQGLLLCRQILYQQEYWSRLPFPTPGDLSDPEIEPASLASPTLTGRFFTTSTTWEALL